MSDFALTPAVALALFIVACLSGMRYRTVWKAEGPRWQLWLFGIIAGLCLLTVGLVPLDA